MAKFKVTVPLDASAIADVPKGHPLKVVGRDSKGKTVSTIVHLDAGKGKATLTFDEKPDNLKVFVGPEDVPDDQIDKLQTISASVPTRTSGSDITATVVRITPFFWQWWRRWCRTYTITGRVLCRDGSPVPGALVCAYDVDWFWWWRSTQQVGCATTAADGTFHLTFKWCCGWFPWWWWKLRSWELDVDIYRRLVKALPPEMKLKRIPLPDPVPNLSLFKNLLPPSASTAIPVASRTASQPDLNRLEVLREPLLKRLTQVPNLETLRIWPWVPWEPWNDCAPDIIFRVTQDCGSELGAVIVNETPFNTRWNIPTNLDVQLTANDRACCLRPNPPCDHRCATLDAVCGIPTDDISGNPASSSTQPPGYAHPGGSGAGHDRPFAGRVDVSATGHCMNEVDYYEVESSFFDPSTSTWSSFTPVPLASLTAFGRAYFDWSMAPLPGHSVGVAFSPTSIDGHDVYETLHHYEQTHDPAQWHVTREWMGATDQLFSWVTGTAIWPDGVYRLQIRGYKQNADGTLSEVSLDACDTPGKSVVTVRIDNRLEDDPAHETGPEHPCIGVHRCVTEPDTDIVRVTIRRPDLTETVVEPCGTYDVHPLDHVDVTFFAHDPDGHLGAYGLDLQWGENASVDLFSFAAPVIGSAAVGSIPIADNAGPTYPGAADAMWHGGVLKISLPAAAFPVTCAYRLHLGASKRTIVSCDGNPQHYNDSHYTFTVIRP